MEETPKLCKDCAHFMRVRSSHYSRCTANRPPERWSTDLVTGERFLVYYEPEYCSVERMELGSCKKEALRFVPRKASWFTRLLEWRVW